MQVLSVYENSSDHDHIFVLSSTAPFDYPSNQSEIDAFYASIDPENPAEIIQDGPFAPGLNFTPSDAASVISSTDNDVWAGSDFSDFWSSGAGNDTLAGGAGDDIMKGGIGSDTYLFEPGDEADVIEESGGESDRVEILITEDIITPDYDISVWRGAQPGSTWEGTLYIQYGQNDILELKNQFASHGAHLVETISIEFQEESGPSQVDEYAMYTGTTGGESADLLVGRTVVDYLKGNGGVDALIAGANNDVLFGHSGDDYLLGGTGNDTLRGGDGADVYDFFDGDGADTIIEYDGVTDLTSVDTIFFLDQLSLSDMDIGRLALDGTTWEGALHFDMGGGDSVTIVNHFASNGRYVVEELELADGITFAMTNQTTGGSANDLLVGREVIDYLKGQGGDDYLIAGGNNDVLFGHSGNDTLTGETGNDTLRGGDGADRYVLNSDDGDDLIIEYDGVEDLSSTDVIVFNDIDDINDLTFSRVAESGSTWEGSLLIEAGADSVRVQHHFASNDRYKIENIELSDGSIYAVDDFVFL